MNKERKKNNKRIYYKIKYLCYFKCFMQLKCFSLVSTIIYREANYFFHLNHFLFLDFRLFICSFSRYGTPGIVLSGSKKHQKVVGTNFKKILKKIYFFEIFFSRFFLDFFLRKNFSIFFLRKKKVKKLTKNT